MTEGVGAIRLKPQRYYVNFRGHAMNPRTRNARIFGRYPNMVTMTPMTLAKYFAVLAHRRHMAIDARRS